MPRSESNWMPVVKNRVLYTNDPGMTGIEVGSAEWFNWLERAESFSFEGCTFRCERRRNGLFWYAYRRIDGKLHKRYAGASARLGLLLLQHVSWSINEPAPEHPI